MAFPNDIGFQEILDGNLPYYGHKDASGNPIPFGIFVRTAAGTLTLLLEDASIAILVPLQLGQNPFKVVTVGAGGTATGCWAVYEHKPAVITVNDVVIS